MTTFYRNTMCKKVCLTRIYFSLLIETTGAFVWICTRNYKDKQTKTSSKQATTKTSVSLQIWDMRYGSCYISKGCIKYWFKV